MKEHMCLKIIKEKSVKLSENKYLLKCINLKCIIYILFSLFLGGIGEERIFAVDVCLGVTLFLFLLMSACGL